MANELDEHTWPMSEAAVVTTDDLSDLFFLSPNIPGNTDMPEAIRFLAGCVLKWRSDPKFVAEICEWYADEIRAMEKRRTH